MIKSCWWLKSSLITTVPKTNYNFTSLNKICYSPPGKKDFNQVRACSIPWIETWIGILAELSIPSSIGCQNSQFDRSTKSDPSDPDSGYQHFMQLWILKISIDLHSFSHTGYYEHWILVGRQVAGISALSSLCPLG